MPIHDSNESGKAASTPAARCRKAGGLVEVSLQDLREEAGFAKLGRWVLEEIKNYLKKNSLGYFPAERLDLALNTEPRQWQTVWIYDRGDNALSKVVEAVLFPDDSDVMVALSGLLPQNAKPLSAKQKLVRIQGILDAPDKPPFRRPSAATE